MENALYIVLKAAFGSLGSGLGRLILKVFASIAKWIIRNPRPQEKKALIREDLPDDLGQEHIRFDDLTVPKYNYPKNILEFYS